jgi:hypothetical protein
MRNRQTKRKICHVTYRIHKYVRINTPGHYVEAGSRPVLPETLLLPTHGDIHIFSRDYLKPLFSSITMKYVPHNKLISTYNLHNSLKVDLTADGLYL